MNYLNKHNPIGDVDMIRILERLDAGRAIDEILQELPEANRAEARELLDAIVLLDTVRDTIIPPREHLQNILQHLDDPVLDETRAVHSVAPKTPISFNLQKYFFPISAMAVVILLVVVGRYLVSPDIGKDAVLFELGTEESADIFPDETVAPAEDSTARNFDALIESETLQETSREASAPQQTTPLSAESVSSRSPQGVSGDLETTLKPLLANETSDAYGVFPEDTFALYLQTLADIPIDHF